MKTNAGAGSCRDKMESDGNKSELRLSATEYMGSVMISEKGSFAKPDSTYAESRNSALNERLSPPRSGPTARRARHSCRSCSWCHQEQFGAPDPLDADSKATKGNVTTVDGQQAVAVVLAEHGESVTWYVATTGKPYFIKQDSTRDNMQDLTDSDFGRPVGAKAPAGSVVEESAV
ncbi:hypothetical protein AQJ46_30485 [Streptomyces canus]|uniref:Uncharacterized protein n=1 Tax=Streptomyces canus TaxID=58343 RepID=A0A101RY98_9ACTN|nr:MULTISPECIES: hypothetical protein [Streptomyces]KUN63933.1 hypothetical protein AQJ46_30485 [Streptomyces canus]MDI5911072.1 hypothetical protein [Streptomyces sp. 12257]